MKKENLQQMLKDAQDELAQLDERKSAKEVGLKQPFVMSWPSRSEKVFPERIAVKGGYNTEISG
jgi:hypothetical protein